MARAHAGLYTEAEVEGPIDTGAVNPVSWLDTSSPHFWATVWFLVAILFLFVL